MAQNESVVSPASADDAGTANSGIGTTIIVLLVIVVSFMISYVAYNTNANAVPVSTVPAPPVPIATPGPATNYSSVPGQLPAPKVTP